MFHRPAWPTLQHFLLAACSCTGSLVIGYGVQVVTGPLGEDLYAIENLTRDNFAPTMSEHSRTHPFH